MDVERIKRALATLDQHPCPMCGHTDWIISGDQALLQSIGGDGGITLGRGVPVVIVACTTCGYINLHWAPTLERFGAEGEQGTGHDQQAQKESG
ncbi:MAG: hypothetical protein QOH58_3262 [Thermoleophilaceae bacterium]|nr:hypothetical protein [Thermoleophilaceae bacterium]